MEGLLVLNNFYLIRCKILFIYIYNDVNPWVEGFANGLKYYYPNGLLYKVTINVTFQTNLILYTQTKLVINHL